MSNTNEKSLDSVKFARLVGILGTLEKHYEGSPININDVDISFEFIIGSLFPHVYTNVQKAINDAYMKGYLQGKEDTEGEKNDN